MDITKILCRELGIRETQAENAVKLIDEGNTIPFIARYRKELTGSLDDQKLRELYDRLMYLRNLDEKREQVRESINEQGALTDEIAAALDGAQTLTEIDDIYRPFRPKRRTRATIAQEKGLSPLADIIWLQLDRTPANGLAEKYINEEKGVLTAEDALQGAKDIIAERISDDPSIRKILREDIYKTGKITSKAVDAGAESVYSPAVLVVVPREVPSTMTVAPATGCPFASETVPEICLFWAVAYAKNTNTAINDSTIFLTISVNFN